VEAFRRGALVAGANDMDRLRGIIDALAACVPAFTRIMDTPVPFA
jgi:hypothetical protein